MSLGSSVPCERRVARRSPGKSEQESLTRGKLRQAQNPPITRSQDVSVAGCASDGAAALGQEPLCPSTNPTLLSPSEVHPRGRLTSVAASRTRPSVPPSSAKSALSASVHWDRRWPQTSWLPGDG